MSPTYAATPFDDWLGDDPEVSRLLDEEIDRQSTTLQLIASENFTSPAVLAAIGLGAHEQVRRGLSGSAVLRREPIIDEVEDLARDRAKALFGAEHANVQPHAGANANLAVYQALARAGRHHPGHAPRPRRPPHPWLAGQHHGQDVAIRLLRRLAGQRRSGQPGEIIDFDQVADVARRERPKLIVAGSTAYSRIIDPAPLPRDRRCGRCPASCSTPPIPAGLIAGKVHPARWVSPTS